MGGVTLRISHPFWYSTSEEEGDVGTKATYRISGDEVQSTQWYDGVPLLVSHPPVES